MKIPTVSIILPTYNRLYCIRKAIRSVIRQTFKNWELIIIDDGSTDLTYKTLKNEINDTRIIIHKIKHAGVSAALNAGVARAQAPLITFLGSDNWYLPKHLEKHLDVFKSNPKLALTTSLTKILGSPYVPDLEKPGKIIHLDKCVQGGTFFIRKNIFNKIGGFGKYKVFEDYYLFHDIKNKGYLVMRRKLRTYVYDRRRDDSLSMEASKKMLLVVTSN